MVRGVLRTLSGGRLWVTSRPGSTRSGSGKNKLPMTISRAGSRCGAARGSNNTPIKIQVKIVCLIVHNVHLIVHNVDLHSRSPRNHVQSYVFWYEHDQRGFPPNFDHGFRPTRTYCIAENGECSNWNTMDQPSLAGNSTHYPGTISTY